MQILQYIAEATPPSCQFKMEMKMWFCEILGMHTVLDLIDLIDLIDFIDLINLIDLIDLIDFNDFNDLINLIDFIDFIAETNYTD